MAGRRGKKGEIESKEIGRRGRGSGKGEGSIRTLIAQKGGRQATLGRGGSSGGRPVGPRRGRVQLGVRGGRRRQQAGGRPSRMGQQQQQPEGAEMAWPTPRQAGPARVAEAWRGVDCQIATKRTRRPTHPSHCPLPTFHSPASHSSKHLASLSRWAHTLGAAHVVAHLLP